MPDAEGPGGTWTALLRAASPGWAGAFLRDFARCVAAAPKGTFVRLEVAPGLDGVVIRSPDARLAASADACLQRLPRVVELAGAPPPLPETAPSRREYLVAVPSSRRRSDVPVADAPRGHSLHRGSAGSDASAVPVPILPFAEIPGVAGLRWESRAEWRARADGRLAVRAAWRVDGGDDVLARHLPALAIGFARRFADGGFPATEVWFDRRRSRAERRWARGGDGRCPTSPGPEFEVAPELAARAIPVVARSTFPTPGELLRHVAVVGASGSGKSAWLAEVARAAIERGTAAVVVDLHGDLGPRLVAALTEPARARVVVLDPTEPRARGAGVRLLGGDALPPEVEAAHVLAALRRIAGDGGETYWGFRIERVLETLLRRVQEERGTLVDLFDLLTDPERREAARLATGVPAVARFLEELPAVLRRNPEYLAPAAARVAKVVLHEELTRLLAPPDAGLPVDALLGDGRALILRLPVGRLGPEASAFAATLLVSRLYLGRTVDVDLDRPRLRTLFVVDEASSLSARLLAEILAEGRKFGVGMVFATQFPERLANELRSAATGAVGSHVVFRVPPASAAATGRWVGLPEVDALRLLPCLPTGVAVVAARPSGDGPSLLAPVRSSPGSARPWESVIASTAAEFPAETDGVPDPAPELDERVLLAVFGVEARGGTSDTAALVRWVASAPGPAVDPAGVPGRLPVLRHRGWVSDDGGAWHLTPAGLAILRGDGRTGATRESAEHRALLLGAFRRFAARGYRLEILRQDRFDTRLPDARVRLLGSVDARAVAPFVQAAALDRAREGWAWRFFGGRDVHVEAEVSGADRRERIRYDLGKARTAGAHLVVLVADDRRAQRVRTVLRSLVDVPRLAQVWTIREAAALRIAAASPSSWD